MGRLICQYTFVLIRIRETWRINDGNTTISGYMPL